MRKENFEKAYNNLIEESKHSSHGFWKPKDFKEWGKKSLNLIDEVCGVSSQYYTLFLRIHHEALVIGTNDSRFDTYVSVCIAILRSVYNESVKTTRAQDSLQN
jgi:hypothetical protein